MRYLDLVVPDFSTTGSGIARYCRSLALALSGYCEGQGWSLRVHSLCDLPQAGDLRYIPPPATFAGYAGDRLRLAKAVVGSAWSHNHVATVFGHVNLATLGLFFPQRGPGSKPYMVVLYGIEAWRPLSLHRRLALRRASAYWAISNYTLETARAVQRLPAKPSSVLSCCLDPFWNSDEPRGDSMSQDESFILTVSRLAEADAYKGIDHLIAAFGRVAPQFEKTCLVIVGEGRERERLEKLAASTNVADRIRFLGAVEQETLADLYRRCVLFAMPSGEEGFGIVYLEAMAAGKPVIAARAGGAPEVVVDGETGLVVPYGSVETLADALERLLSNENLRREFGRAGRNRVERRFSFENLKRDVREAVNNGWLKQ